jgi:hypothetical protein
MTAISHPSVALTAATPAGRALRQADKGIGNWLMDLVTGAGSSPAHIIITGILGVVPGVGQAMDARDLILGIITISKTPAAIGGWVELVITLIGCVPAVGDALKVGFRLMKQGHNFGRVLEAVSPALRGNVEKFMRKIDWTMLSRESKGLFTKTISAFIDGLDSWVMKSVAGGPAVKQIVAELKAVQKRAPAMIDEAFKELKTLHTKMMGHELPGTTAAAAATSSKVLMREAEQAAATAVTKQQVQAVRAQRKLLASRSRDIKANRVAPNSTKNSVKKKGAPKKQTWRTGIPAEHITDYMVKKKHTNFRKANNFGKLIEENSLPHHGLDHLWSNKTSLTKPYIVGDTKSSLFDSFRLLAALPAEMQEKFAMLRADEAANPDPKSGMPNIFENEDRDTHANRRVSAGHSGEDESAVRKGVNRPNEHTQLATQMSHAWILQSIRRELSLTSSGVPLKRLAREYKDGEISCPYQRWISLVTGRQLHKHQNSHGALHEVQVILSLPDNILDK